jgi:hypothetical protein
MEWLTNLIQAAGLSGADLGGASRFGSLAPQMSPREAMGGVPGGAMGAPIQPGALDNVAAGATPAGTPMQTQQQAPALPGLLGQQFGANRPMGANLAAQGFNMLKQPAMQQPQWMPWMR